MSTRQVRIRDKLPFFNKRFIRLCEESGLSLPTIAGGIGCSLQVVCNWQRGSLPSLEMLPKIARFFGVTTDYLCGNIDDRG